MIHESCLEFLEINTNSDKDEKHTQNSFIVTEVLCLPRPASVGYERPPCHLGLEWKNSKVEIFGPYLQPVLMFFLY